MTGKEMVDVPNAGVVKRSDYESILRKIIDEGHCPFCREHLFKHHTKPILAEGEHWLVTENFKPYAGTKQHFLLISQRHVERIEDLTPEAWSEFQLHYATLSKKYGLRASTLLWRSGETAFTGATVVHLHAQIIVGQERTEDSAPIMALVGFKKNGG
jgi:ATP adenylyltransferase